MKSIFVFSVMLSALILCGCSSLTKSSKSDSVFQFQDDVETRVITFENTTGERGNGGQRNKGGKGAAMNFFAPGESKVIAEIEGPGIINRLWMTTGGARTLDGNRNIIIEIYWEGDSKPAVSAPINDFFGMSLPIKIPFESELFSQPEGNSYNSFVQMPFHKSAKVVIRNLTKVSHMIFFELNYSLVKQLPSNSLYFHAYWHRDIRTELKKDFEILPKVEGKGRFLGCTVGVICDPVYQPSWFGEGEVKTFLDGDTEFPTICGTGTEDYIGTGWGQGPYANMTQGSPIGDKNKGLYSFYRFHTMDPIFFSEDCKVTIQQMGNATTNDVRNMVKRGAELEPCSVWTGKLNRIYEGDCEGDINSPDFLNGGVNFWRRDDVCATAYFYLDKTSTDLPAIQDEGIRLHNLDRLR